MVKRITWFILLLVILLPYRVSAVSQRGEVKMYHAKNLRKWKVPSGGYSGIAYLGGDSFAIVSDCHSSDAVKILHVTLHPKKGKLQLVSLSPFQPYLTGGMVANGKSLDLEDLAYNPYEKTLFLVSEAQTKVTECTLLGNATGNEWALTEMISPGDLQNGYGIESLTYDMIGHLWVVTEAALKSDITLPYGTLRLWQLTSGCKQKAMYRYQMDAPRWKGGTWYAHGVSALLAMKNGHLLVMEREVSVPAHYVGARTHIKIYDVNPPANQETIDIKSMKPLEKRLLCQFTTRLSFGRMNFGNYEGMTLGPSLDDGRQTLLLVSDSQNGMGNAFYHLRDYLKVIVLP